MGGRAPLALLPRSGGQPARDRRRRSLASLSAWRRRPRTLTEARAQPRSARAPVAARARAASLPKALERIGGIQAQYAPSMYVGLWTPARGLRARGARPGRSSAAPWSRAPAARDDPPGDAARLVAVLGRDRERRRQRVAARRASGPTAAQMAAAVARRSARALDDGPVAREGVAGDDRPRSARVSGDQRLARPGPRAAVGNLGSPPRRSVRRRRRLDRPRPEPSPPRRPPSSARSYLRGFGPGDAAEIADWAGLRRRRSGGARAARAAPLPRRGRRGARRPAARCRCRTPRRRLRRASCRSGTRRCSSTLAARRSSPSEHRAEGVQHEDAAVGRHLPRRRQVAGHLALREGPGEARAVRAARQIGADRRRRGGGTPRRLSRLSGGLGSARCPR